MKTTRDAKGKEHSEPLPYCHLAYLPSFQQRPVDYAAEKSSLPSGNIFPNVISLGISSGNQWVWKHLGRPSRKQNPLQNEKN